MSEAGPTISIEAIDAATTAAVRLERVLSDLARPAYLDLYAKTQRFRFLCADLFGMEEIRNNPVLRAASLTVRAVETGHLGRRQIRQHIDQALPDMPAEDRAFAAGLAMGFMTEFLPRRS